MKSRNAARYVREASIVMALDDELRQADERADRSRSCLRQEVHAMQLTRCHAMSRCMARTSSVCEQCGLKPATVHVYGTDTGGVFLCSTCMLIHTLASGRAIVEEQEL